VLEIGCGTGELAASLVQDGVPLIAIDNDADSIAAAQALGVDARIAAWPNFEDGLFDAVLFSRSLHHMHPLAKAVQRAADTLVIGGRLIVEDFAYETADEKTLQWFAVDRLDAADLLIKEDDFLNAVRSKTKTLKAWRENHESDLHTAAAILTEIRKVFDDVRGEEAPYYFRYLSRAIVANADRDKTLQGLVEEEAEFIARGTILALRRRFVAERSK
jgi:SAM-dependent methyltransferase